MNPANEARVALDVDGLHLALVLVADVQRGANTLCIRDDAVAKWAISILRFMGYDVATRRLPGVVLSQEIFISLPGEDHSG